MLADQNTEERRKAFAAIVHAKRYNPHFHTVSCSLEFHHEKDGIPVKSLCEYLATGDTTLKELTLTDNALGDAGIKDIAESLQNNKHNVESLILSLSTLGDVGVRAIVEAQKINPTLRSLFLFRNPLGDEGVKAIFELLNINKTLTTLRLWKNHINAERVKPIVNGLKNNKTLKHFDLANNELGNEGGVIVAKGLEDNTTLKTLNLYNNGLGAKAGQAIYDALQTNLTLQKIFLGNNQIDAKMEEKIEELLKRNRKIAKKKKFDEILEQVRNNIYVSRNLDLSKYRLDAARAKALAEALKSNTAIKSLHIFWNVKKCHPWQENAEVKEKENTEKVKAVDEILNTNRTLTELQLINDAQWYDGIQCEHLEVIAEALEHNTTLLQLSWPRNRSETKSEIPSYLRAETPLEAVEKTIKKYLSRNYFSTKMKENGLLRFSTNSQKPVVTPSVVQVVASSVVSGLQENSRRQTP